MSDADAQYIVDVAAQMSGAQQTLAQLDAVTANLTGASRSAVAFDSALVSLSNQLSAAKAATLAANSALASGESQYAALEKAALQAAKAEEKAALLGAVPPDVAAKAAAASAAVNQYAQTLKGLETAAASAKAQENQLSQSLKNAEVLSRHVAAADADKARAEAKAAADEQKHASEIERAQREQEGGIKRLKGALPALGGAFGQVGGQVAGAIDDFGDLTEVFGKGGAAAIAATGGITILIAALAALVIGLGVATIKTAIWAVGLADTARSAGLATEAFEAMNPGVAALHSNIAQLVDVTGLSESALDNVAKSLIEAKVSAEDLPEALKAAAYAEKALGQGGSSQFIAQLKEGKKSVKALAAETQQSLGGIVVKQMMGLSDQSATLQKNIGRIFGGLDIDPVLAGMQKLVALFDENTASGRALKFIFESVFQPLINQAEKAATVVEGFVLGFLIGATKLYIALKPVVKAIGEFFGENDPSLTETLAAATKAGEFLAPVVVALVVGFTAAAAVVATVVGISLALVAAFVALPAVIIAAAVALTAYVDGAIQGAVDYITSIDFLELGANMMKGLAQGITGAAGAVVDAMSHAVTGAIKSAKDLLGIHSPSRVFAAIGQNTGEGFVQGIDATAPDAQAALGDMVSPLQAQDAASPPAAPSGGSKKGGKASLDLSGSTFNFYGVKDAEHAEQSFGEMFTRLLEGDLSQMGRDPEPA